MAEALKLLAGKADAINRDLLVLNVWENTTRRVKVAPLKGRKGECPCCALRRFEWLEGRDTVGVTSGASAPEWLVERVVEDLKARGAREVCQLHTVDEQMRFSLPVAIREPVA